MVHRSTAPVSLVSACLVSKAITNKINKIKRKKKAGMLSAQEVPNGREDRRQLKKTDRRTLGMFSAPQTTPQPLMTPENFHIVWPKIRLMLIM